MWPTYTFSSCGQPSVAEQELITANIFYDWELEFAVVSAKAAMERRFFSPSITECSLCYIITYSQGCGSGSAWIRMDPHSFSPLDPDRDPGE